MKKIPSDSLREAIEKGIYIDSILFNHFHKWMEHPVLKPLIQLVLKTHWKCIEELLTDAYKLREFIISERPELKEMLYSPKAIVWLNEVCKRGYARLYSYTWL